MDYAAFAACTEGAEPSLGLISKGADEQKNKYIKIDKRIDMTSSAIRAKVHQYIDEVDEKVLDVVCQFLEAYQQHNASELTDEQKSEVLQRTESYKVGKAKGYAITEARKLVKEKRLISKRTSV